MYPQESTDALFFISQTISYFYEKYEQVKFRLYHDIHSWQTKQTGPCFVGLSDIPLVENTFYGPTSLPDGTFENDAVTEPCLTL